MTTDHRPLLTAVRRRLRWAWALATAQWAAPAVAALALGIVLSGLLWGSFPNADRSAGE